MKAKLKLRIKFKTSRLASYVDNVLHPDNKYPPPDQMIETHVIGDCLEINIISTRAGSALSSARSILSDVKLFSGIVEGFGDIENVRYKAS